MMVFCVLLPFLSAWSLDAHSWVATKTVAQATERGRGKK